MDELMGQIRSFEESINAENLNLEAKTIYGLLKRIKHAWLTKKGR